MLAGGVGAALKGAGVTVVNGTEAKITGRSADGFTVTDGKEAYTAARLLIAAGSVPAVPPIPGLKEAVTRGFVLTSREMLDIEAVPGKSWS